MEAKWRLNGLGYLNFHLAGLCPLETDGSIHLGRVQEPIGEPHDGDRRVDEDGVEHLEGHVGAMLCQTNLV